MTPHKFAESNAVFGPPEGMNEAQVKSIPAFIGEITAGGTDGSRKVIVAWKPDEDEIRAIIKGAPIFLTCLGGLPPHCLTLSFEEANKVQ